MRRTFLALMALCAFSGSAFAQTVAHSGNSTVTTATAVTVTVTVGSGDLAQICADQNVNNTSTLSITDSASQTGWTQAGGYASGSSAQRSGCFYHPNSAALTSITATWSGSLSARVGGRAIDISGVATSSPLDAAATTTGCPNCTTLASGSLTTTNANDILINDMTVTANETTFTPGTGFSQPTSSQSARGDTLYKVVTATQSAVTTTPSWNATGTTAEMFFAYKKAAGGAAACQDSVANIGAGAC